LGQWLANRRVVNRDRDDQAREQLFVGASGTKIRSFNTGMTSVRVDQDTTNVGTNLQSPIWTLTGGYTVAEGT
jgi:hypothetical protein